MLANLLDCLPVCLLFGWLPGLFTCFALTCLDLPCLALLASLLACVLCVCLTVCLLASRSLACLICLPACQSACLPVCLSASLALCLSASLPLCLPVCLSVCPSACPPACPSACLSLTECQYKTVCLFLNSSPVLRRFATALRPPLPLPGFGLPDLVPSGRPMYFEGAPFEKSTTKNQAPLPLIVKMVSFFVVCRNTGPCVFPVATVLAVPLRSGTWLDADIDCRVCLCDPFWTKIAARKSEEGPKCFTKFQDLRRRKTLWRVPLHYRSSYSWCSYSKVFRCFPR